MGIDLGRIATPMLEGTYPEIFCNTFAGFEDFGGCVKLIWATTFKQDGDVLITPKIGLVLPSHVLIVAAQQITAASLLAADFHGFN